MFDEQSEEFAPFQSCLPYEKCISEFQLHNRSQHVNIISDVLFIYLPLILSRKLLHSHFPSAYTICMKKYFIQNFLLCGSCGWCMECLWTGLNSIRKHTDRELTCHTSVWMFPIYGMAACLNPICFKLKNKSVLLRGGVYTLLIYATEYTTGVLLKKFGACPWDYSKAKFNYKGVVRLDYAPAWFFAGLFFENVINRKGGQ